MNKFAYLEENIEISERFELVSDRVKGIVYETTVEQPFRDFFIKEAQFLLTVFNLYEQVQYGDYDKFSLKELEEKNMPQEVGSFTRFPDIIMMDGGRGQVNIALDVLKELGLNIPVCGMVKDDTHSTRGLYYNNIEIPIDKHSEGFKLITRVQDEAHRFAITYHRSLRDKAQVSSVLDSIEGIGPVRRKALMKHFLDIEKIRQASVDELMKADGITENVAENIYKFFH